MTNLITVPTFTYSQGDTYDGAEYPVTVCYYNNGDDASIELTQGDNNINFTNLQQLKSLIKQIEKHLPEATKKLNL
jgi:hypothetical protein